MGGYSGQRHVRGHHVAVEEIAARGDQLCRAYKEAPGVRLEFLRREAHLLRHGAMAFRSGDGDADGRPQCSPLSWRTEIERLSHARRTMRKNWILTPTETVIFIAGVALLAGGAMWATAIG